jgi:hypothetical protein
MYALAIPFLLVLELAASLERRAPVLVRRGRPRSRVRRPPAGGAVTDVMLDWSTYRRATEGSDGPSMA